jgi:broad specificity phosphatase PhoE
MADWDEPFAREALARALAATGQPDLATAELGRAQELAAAVADAGDREVLVTELRKEPWFGLR